MKRIILLFALGVIVLGPVVGLWLYERSWGIPFPGRFTVLNVKDAMVIRVDEWTGDACVVWALGGKRLGLTDGDYSMRDPDDRDVIEGLRIIGLDLRPRWCSDPKR